MLVIVPSFVAVPKLYIPVPAPVIVPSFVAVPKLYIPIPAPVIIPSFVAVPSPSLYIPLELVPFTVIVVSLVTSSIPLFLIPSLYEFLVIIGTTNFNVPLFFIVDASLLLVPVAEFVIMPVFSSELSTTSKLPSAFVIDLNISIVYPFKSSIIFLFVAIISFVSVIFLSTSIVVGVSDKFGTDVITSIVVFPANFMLFIITWSLPELPLPSFLYPKCK